MRRAIRLMLSVAVVICLYLPYAKAAHAQQQRQSGQTAPASSTTPAAQTAAPSKPLDIRGHASESLIDDSIKEDPGLKQIIAPYRSKVEELNVPIGKLASDLKKTGMGGGSLGNFVTDALRAVAEKRLGRPVLLAVINTSGMRKNSIAAGDISTADVYELLPFENALVTLDLTGEQLRRFMDVNVARRNAQSGARIVYRDNPEKKRDEIVSLKLVGAGAQRDIDPKATYTILTIDFLVKRGGDYAVLQEAKNVRPLNVTMRDALIEYVKAETAAGRQLKASPDGRFKYEGSKPAADEEQQ